MWATQVILLDSIWRRGAVHEYRPLGLGYANLGALLMYFGLAYDSPGGRALAATITALMTGQAYLSSSILASSIGPFDEYEKNAKPMLNVMKKHKDAVKNIENSLVPDNLIESAEEVWTEVLEFGSNLRISECPNHGTGSHRYHWIYDGL
ncbi:MAG: hypothetical protein U5R06_06090 [candidate division KSB1 bacterium]|nr:hypothetical protein [candidate division KSB1 bacterium]